jgi:hypothetical protein
VFSFVSILLRSRVQFRCSALFYILYNNNTSDKLLVLLDKERLHEQIETDRDMVAAMDSTLEALRLFVVDKGKGRDRG